jgi:hypothetical protein
VVDTPVVVSALVDREDLILQRVGVVADDTELDAGGSRGRGRHLDWYAYSISKKRAIRFTVLWSSLEFVY